MFALQSRARRPFPVDQLTLDQLAQAGALTDPRLQADPGAGAPSPTALPRQSSMFGGMVARDGVLNDPNARPSEREAAIRNGTSNTDAVIQQRFTNPAAGPAGDSTVDGFDGMRPDGGPPPRANPLGGSMRQPFDYEGAIRALSPQEKKRSTGQKVADAAALFVMGAAGNQAGVNAFAQRRRTNEQRAWEVARDVAQWKHADWARQNGADLGAAAPFTIGRDRLQYDPTTGETNTLYDGPEDFESYAEAKGFEPGSQQYFDAVEDYVLRSNGPTAYGRDKALDDYRTGNRLKMEGVRQGNRMTVRGSPTYRDTHPQPGGGGRRSARPTATGPNGQKVEWDGNAWVPVQ